MDIGKIAFDLIVGLVLGVIQSGINLNDLSYFESRRIKRRIEDSLAETIEPLLPFLEAEKVPTEKQGRLFEIIVEELEPLTKSPDRFFRGSLDGQKIFDELYATRSLPQAIIEDDLSDIYSLLCPRVATLLCKVPAAVKDWESEAWAESFRRLDDLAIELTKIYTAVDSLTTIPGSQADELLLLVRRSLAQRIRMELDLTGLRADKPVAGKFDHFFVHPEIRHIRDETQDLPLVSSTPADSINIFTKTYNCAVVFGAPGAGKSTWSTWLERELVTPNWTGLCVRIELRGLAYEALPSIHELVRKTAGTHLAEDLTPERISRWLDAKQLLFVLDGFDEVPPSYRDAVVEWLRDLHAAARGCSFVVTSRPLTTGHLDHLDEPWRKWSIMPFDRQRVIDYIQRWYQHSPLLIDGKRDAVPEDLADSWQQDPTIEPLTGNPLLLSTLLMVHHLDGSLPSGRSQLYARYIDGMLGIWDSRRKVSASLVQLSLEQRRMVIRRFALAIFLDQRESLEESEMLEWLQITLTDMNCPSSSEDVLTLLMERTGLIDGPGTISFVHKTIAEFLVAETVLQGDQRDTSGNRIDRFWLYEHRDDDRWNATIFLWAGLAPLMDVEAFVVECLDSRQWSLGYGLLLDQYARFSNETRQAFLLKLIEFGNFPGTYGNERAGYSHRWSTAGPGAEHLEIPSFRLRGMSNSSLEPPFGNLFFAAVRDGSLEWDSYRHASNNAIRDLLWMAFVCFSHEFATWRECLAEPFPSVGSEEQWAFFVAETILHRLREVNEDLVSAMIDEFSIRTPYASGLLQLAAISHLYDLILEKEVFQRHVCFVLDLITRFSKYPCHDNYLKHTIDWMPSSFEAQGSRIDILQTLTREFGKPSVRDLVTCPEKYDDAMAAVVQLTEARSKICDEDKSV